MKDKNLELLKANWDKVKNIVKEQFGEEPDLQTVLFLIGVQELGKGQKKFTKREKMELMHIAICKLLSYYGYYKLMGQDKEGWPLWEKTEHLPHLNVQQQDRLLREASVEYFKEQGLIELL